MSASTQAPTLEVDGKVYALASINLNNDAQTYTTSRGDLYTVRSGNPYLEAKTSDARARELVNKGAMRCRVELGGQAYTGHVELVGWSPGFALMNLRVHDIQPITATPAPAVSVPEQEITWSELRSACHRKAWREAWEIVGTDHTGGATPGEVYIFGVARQARAVSAALHHWLQCHDAAARAAAARAQGIAFFEDFKILWQRIKQVAAWESKVAAQFVKRAPKEPRAVDARITINGREVTGYRDGWDTVRATIRSSTPDAAWGPDLDAIIVDDSNPEPLAALLEMQRTIDARAHIARTMPQEIWITPEVAAALQQRASQAQGIAGVLNNPFMSRVRVVPSSMMPAPQPEIPRAQRRRRK